MNSFGIDFGTTNSAAFELYSRQAYGDEEARPLPSIVIIDKATDRAFGGRRAWKEQLSFRERGGYHVISSIKTLLETNREWFSAQKRWRVADIAAVVLRQLNERTLTAGGITEAMFGIPVGMSPKARRTLREAAQLAGIRVTGFVKESTAAVIRYWETVKNCRYVVVFDWGGGTLDISVLELRGRHIQELATVGSANAGNRVDDDLARRVHRLVMETRGTIKALEDLSVSQQDDLRYHCELAKCALATQDAYRLSLFNYDGRDETLEVTRSFCEPVVKPHVTEAIDLLASAINKAELSTDAIDEILVIGGCSQLWLFREKLRQDARFLAKSTFAENPEWDVAHGAALLQKNPGCFALGEALGVQLSDGTRFDLVRPGDISGQTNGTVSLALVEDTRAANIIVERHLGNGGMPETALAFAIPTQGFDLEEIRLDYHLSEDLTFQVSGQSMARDTGTRVERETGELRFTYAIEEER